MSNNQAPQSFEAPPSQHNVANVISSQQKTLYLNKPKYYREEGDTGTENPSQDTPQSGNSSSTEPEHDWAKRYSDLKSYHDKQEQNAKAEKEALVRTLQDKEQALEQARQKPIEMPTTPEALDAFITKYPHMADVMRTLAIKEVAKSHGEFNRMLKEQQERTNAVASAEAMRQLIAIHPDVEHLKRDPDFKSWADKQLPAVKELLNSARVDDVARGIDIYKKDVGITYKTSRQKEEEALKASMSIPTSPRVDVGTGGGKIWRASEVQAIPRNQYHKYEGEILKALAEGRYRENE